MHTHSDVESIAKLVCQPLPKLRRKHVLHLLAQVQIDHVRRNTCVRSAKCSEVNNEVSWVKKVGAAIAIRLNDLSDWTPRSCPPTPPQSCRRLQSSLWSLAPEYWDSRGGKVNSKKWKRQGERKKRWRDEEMKEVEYKRLITHVSDGTWRINTVQSSTASRSFSSALCLAACEDTQDTLQLRMGRICRQKAGVRFFSSLFFYLYLPPNFCLGGCWYES